MGEGFWSEFWAAIRHQIGLFVAFVGLLSLITGGSIVSFVRWLRRKEKPARRSKQKGSAMKEAWAWITRHKVPVVVLVSLIGLFGLVLPWAGYTVQNNLRNEVTDLQTDMDSLLDSVRFNLAFDGVVVDTGTTAENTSIVNVAIRLQNTSQQLIQFEVVDFSVVLGERTVSNPVFLTTGEYCYPGKTSNYYYPTIKGIDLSQVVLGTLEYEVHYSSVPNKHWYMSSRKLALTLSDGTLTWRTLDEEEVAID